MTVPKKPKQPVLLTTPLNTMPIPTSYSEEYYIVNLLYLLRKKTKLELRQQELLNDARAQGLDPSVLVGKACARLLKEQGFLKEAP